MSNEKRGSGMPDDRRVLLGPDEGVEFIPDQTMLDEQAEEEARLDAFEKEGKYIFVIMPLKQEFDDVYATIRGACGGEVPERHI